MQVDDKTPRRPFRIQGVGLEVPAPFNEGHTCTAAEASALNQILAENVRNNCADKIKKALNGAEPSSLDKKALGDLQGQVDEYVGAYEFGQRRGGGGGGARDPIEKEMMNLARQTVKKAMAAKGIPAKDQDAKEITRLAQDLVKKEEEKLRAVATQVHEARMEGLNAL